MMKIVADQDRHFRIVGSMCPGEPSYTQNLAPTGREFLFDEENAVGL